MARSNGMIFMGNRCAKQRHDPIALNARDGAFKLMDRRRHRPHHGIYQTPRRFWIHSLDRACGTGKIGKQDRYDFAFTAKLGERTEEPIG